MGVLGNSAAVRKAKELKIASLVRSAALSVLGVSDIQRSVRCNEDEKGISVDVFLIVEYGCRIPEVAWNVQETVKNTLTEQLQQEVVAVNIYVQGVRTLL